MFFANLFVNIDMGIFPAAVETISDDLSINKAQFGMLGSIVYLGQTIGSGLATGIL